MRAGKAKACAALIAPLLALALVPAAAQAGYTVHRGIDYDRGSPPQPPSTPEMSELDLYVPHRGGARRAAARRPVVVWIHGGGWRRGDKRTGARRKAELFTKAGYVFASVNYRLSAAPFDPRDPDPHRVRFPAHPDDVGEALGWLDRRLRGDRRERTRFVLVGHSAGAHLASLVATSPRYGRRHGVQPGQIAGFVALDTPSFDIAAAADAQTSTRPEEGREMFWNAFAAPGEPGARETWRRASPVIFAGRGDPPGLLVTQRYNHQRRTDHRAMIGKLGRGLGGRVLAVELDHREINHALGAGPDRSGVKRATMRFVRRVSRDPG